MNNGHAPKLPEIFHDHGSYWLRVNNDRFLNVDARNAKLHGRRAQFRVDNEDDFGLKAGDNWLVVAQLDRNVDYAGPLAGHRAGPVNRPDGSRILVTSEVKPIEAKRGKIERWDKYLSELLPGDQALYFLCWLKVARESLRRHDFSPGQLAVFPGPSGCGKSFLQALITPFLGGRSAKPYRYMIGETQFNSDLAAAEHHVIEDENASADIRSRRKFGTSIKEFTVNTEMSVHAKCRQAITLPTFRRLTLSVNNEPENLMILPPMDASLLDKVMLFNCRPAALSSDREKNWREFTAELPALAWTLDRMTIPPKMRDPRFGVRAYHDPEILEMLSDISPETRLLNLIEEVLFKKRQGETHEGYKDRMAEPWRGSAEQLEKELRSSPFTFAVERLLYYSSSCGVYLARLMSTRPARFEQRKVKGRSEWLIKKGE